MGRRLSLSENPFRITSQTRPFRTGLIFSSVCPSIAPARGTLAGFMLGYSWERRPFRAQGKRKGMGGGRMRRRLSLSENPFRITSQTRPFRTGLSFSSACPSIAPARGTLAGCMLGYSRERRPFRAQGKRKGMEEDEWEKDCPFLRNPLLRNATLGKNAWETIPRRCLPHSTSFQDGASL